MSEEQTTALAEKKNPAAIIRMGSTGIRLSTFEDLWRFSNVIVESGFAPNGMNTAEKVAIALEYGMELGIAPMQALQGMYVVNGKPCVYGDLFLALVKSDPRWDENRFAEWFTGDPYNDDFTAHCQMARLGVQNPHVEAYSVGDARRAGLFDKSGPWKQHPKRMLKMRARTFCGRDTFPERLRGLTTVEEAQDFIDVEVRDARPQVAMPQRLPAAQPQPAADDTIGPAERAYISQPQDAPEAQETPAETQPADGDLIPQILAEMKAKGWAALSHVLKNFDLKAPVKAKDLEGWNADELRNLLRDVVEAQ